MCTLHAVILENDSAYVYPRSYSVFSRIPHRAEFRCIRGARDGIWDSVNPKIGIQKNFVVGNGSILLKKHFSVLYIL